MALSRGGADKLGVVAVEGADRLEGDVGGFLPKSRLQKSRGDDAVAEGPDIAAPAGVALVHAYGLHVAGTGLGHGGDAPLAVIAEEGIILQKLQKPPAAVKGDNAPLEDVEHGVVYLLGEQPLLIHQPRIVASVGGVVEVTVDGIPQLGEEGAIAVGGGGVAQAGGHLRQHVGAHGHLHVQIHLGYRELLVDIRGVALLENAADQACFGVSFQGGEPPVHVSREHPVDAADVVLVGGLTADVGGHLVNHGDGAQLLVKVQYAVVAVEGNTAVFLLHEGEILQGSAAVAAVEPAIAQEGQSGVPLPPAVAVLPAGPHEGVGEAQSGGGLALLQHREGVGELLLCDTGK